MQGVGWGMFLTAALPRKVLLEQANAVQQVMAAGDDASHKAQLVASVRQLVMQVQV